jgi:hypothetical protein
LGPEAGNISQSPRFLRHVSFWRLIIPFVVVGALYGFSVGVAPGPGQARNRLAGCAAGALAGAVTAFSCVILIGIVAVCVFGVWKYVGRKRKSHDSSARPGIPKTSTFW